MRWCVAITRQEDRPPLVLGPFRSEAVADRKCAAVERALHAEGLYYDVTVEPIYVGTTALREIAEMAA